MMEPDASIETSSMIRVAVLPIGSIPPLLLREYVSLVVRYPKVELSTISSFYTEHQKSPFSHQPWDSGSIRFKYILGGSPPSPWEDFQSNRKILAVIGFCHCPTSPDLNAVLDQFHDSCKSYTSALVKRCFAFQPSDSQLEDDNKKSRNIILFPPADRQTQEFHLNTMMQDVAASLLMELEKCVLQAESSGAILKTPLDSQASLSSEEVIKAKKRRLGRAQKTIGDYCLLAGSPVDANAHYSTSLELARLTGDYFWYAGALEGSVCALMIDRAGQRDVALEEEVRYRYGSVIVHYRKSFIQDNSQRVSPLSFELEATLKLARFLCRRDSEREVVELLTSAADGAKSLIDANDRLVLYVEIARLFGNLGYHRKAAFFSRQVSQLYLQQGSRQAAICAMQVLLMAIEAYHIESRASALEEVGSPDAEGSKFHSQSVISLFDAQWSTLQMVVLKEMLMSSVRAGDPLAAWSAAARLLRSYYPLINPAGQNGLASALSKSAERLPSETRCADPALPFIRVHSFPLQPSQLGIIKRNQTSQDWWAGSAPSGPFIYTPFHKGDSSYGDTQDLTWVVGEQVQVLVELANPCAFIVAVDSISLFVKSGKFDAFPVSVTLPPNSSKVITLSGIPTSVGQVNVPGCIVKTFGVVTEHLFKDVDNLLLGATQGLVLSDPFRSCGSPRRKNVSVPSISVVPPLPLLVSHIVGGDSAIILYEGEIRDVWISFANAGTVPVGEAHVSISGKNQDSVVSVAYDLLRDALPLNPGAEVTLPLRLKAWQLGLLDIEITPSRSLLSTRHSKDTSSPVLVLHYAGSVDPLACDIPVPPGRRLMLPLDICVLPGLSFVKACLLSMEIPAHVGETLSKSANSQGKMDGLVKMDPYRGSWGLRLLELELSNPTDVVFEITVSVIVDDSGAEEIVYPKTRIDRDYSSRVLIPLENFKLPILDASFFMKDLSEVGEPDGGRSSLSEKNTKAELDGLIRSLISRIKVKWQSGRNSSGELNIRDATHAALEASVMDVLLPDPLTFGFRLTGSTEPSSSTGSDFSAHTLMSKSSVLDHDVTPMEVLVRNNTRDMIRMHLSITCRDVAGENCIEGDRATVLWAGVLGGILMEVPPLQETKHSFSLYFLVPGEYTLWAAAVIENPNDIIRIRAKTDSPHDPVFCRGAPFNMQVKGIA